MIVNDYPVVSDGLAFNINSDHEDINVVGVVDDSNYAFDLIAELLPDVVLIDFSRHKNSANLVNRIHSEKTKFLTVSGNVDDTALEYAFRLGVSGYILIDSPVKEIITGITAVHGGGAFFSKKVVSFFSTKRQLALSYDTLTQREKEVLIAIAEGKRNKVIASDMKISIRTVETHRKRIKKKLSLGSMSDFTIYAMQNGLLHLNNEAEFSRF